MGVATGDAIGKQTETLSFDNVRRWYPDGVRGFEGTPGAIIPRYVGNRKREWRVGETTDDTERTIAVARAIVRDTVVSHVSIGREMLSCTKCIHPGIASLWEFHAAANPAYIATRHDGCGAAIRVSPVGIVHAPHRFDELVNAAREASISTHGGLLAIAAAAATAAAVSAAIDGASSDDVFAVATRAATAPVFADAMRRVRDDIGGATRQPAVIAGACFPDGPLTIVPLAIALATTIASAEEAILLAANVGGDSDSVASIAGAILGAMHPQTINQEWSEVVEAVNGHKLTALSEQLAALRH
jgi:ADP-ribosylglycohydrolase